MSKYHDRMEHGFERLARSLCGHPWLVMIAMLVLSFALATGIPRIVTDTSNEGYLHPDDPILLEFENFREQFGRDDLIMIALQPKKDVFDPEFLKVLQGLHNQLEDETPHLDDMYSLVNARSTEGRGDTLYVDELLKKWPQNQGQWEALRERVMSNPLYLDRLVSRDAKTTMVLLKIDAYVSEGGDEDVLAGFDDEAIQNAKRRRISDPELSVVVHKVENILKAHQKEVYTYHYAGVPVFSDEIKRIMMSDMKKFMGLAVAIISLVLLLLFRRIIGLVLPLFVVGLSMIASMGCMGWLGIKFTTPITILPSFLISVGVGSSVHILVIFFRAIDRESSRTQAMVHALGHSGLAVLMTSLTTAAGLASFAGAEVAPIAHLGLLSCLGVLLSLLYTIIMLPALLAVIPVKPKKKSGFRRSGRLDALLDRLSIWTTKRPVYFLAVSFVVLGISITGIVGMGFSHDPLRWLPDYSLSRMAYEEINQTMAGTSVFELILDTGRENGLHDPKLLNAIDRLSRKWESEPVAGVRLGKVTSLADILKEIHQALNQNQPEMYRIPQNPRLIPQELLLFENSGSDDLEDVVDSRFQVMRVTISFPHVDALKLLPLMNRLESMLHEEIDPDIKFHITGMGSLFGRILRAAIYSAARSYGIALVVITLMMIFLIGNVRVGLVSMIPNLAPILITLGFMGFFQVPLDLFNMLVASIAIGLAVDDTVHFMHNFRRYYSRYGDVTRAVRKTFHTTGRAMITTTVVLSLGFVVFTMAEMVNYFHFGLLISMSVCLALAADFLLAPALMALIHRQPETSQNGSEEMAGAEPA